MRHPKGKKAPPAAGAKPAALPPILERIARGMGFETLETRNSDRLDFRDLSVWEIKRALGEAYQAGYDAAVQEMEAHGRRGR